MGYTLSNGILTVQLADVGSYRGTRFDWTGFITQITLEKGKHTFCVSESLIPGQGTGGAGLCNEFGISRAIGYDEIEVGEWFPKPGVGLLQKQSSDSYAFDGIYPLIPFHVSVEYSKHSVTYTVHPMECRGYSMLMSKTVSIEGDRLSISYTLENKGIKPLHTEEYVHNFIGIDHKETGAEYELRVPGELKVEEPESSYTENLLQVYENTLSWRGKPDRPFYCRLSGWENAGSDMYWELVNRQVGAGLRESGDFRAERMALWGEGHVISSEVFADISILPRHSKHWRRIYQFFTL